MSGYRSTVYGELSYHSRGFLQICRAENGCCFSAAWVLFSLGKQAEMAKGTRRDISLADSVDLVFHLLCADDEFLVFIVEKSAECFGAVACGVIDSVTAGLAVLTQRGKRFAG